MEDLKNMFKEIMSYDRGISADTAISCATQIFNNSKFNYSNQERQKFEKNNNYQKEPKWMKDPMTEFQRTRLDENKDMLIAAGVDFDSLKTKGQASKIIDEFNLGRNKT